MLQTLRGKAACLLFFLILVGGCSSSSSGPNLAPVKGQVLFKNQGVTAAEIYFMPDADKGNNGSMASAVLQEDGSFTMTTYPRGEGVAPGWYRVTLGLGRRPEKELNKYRRFETTPLKVEIPEEGRTDLVFELDKPPKE